jgi:hypothetical protein
MHSFLLKRFCYTYDRDNMEISIPPVLKPGERIHYPIFHDKCCVHANDQCTFVWAHEGELPLRNKSCGRIVHVSDFIIEHCGCLALWQFEQEAQEKLLKAPLCPVVPITTPAAAPSTSALTENPTSVTTPSSLANLTTGSGSILMATKKATPKKAAAKNVPATHRTLEDVDA